mgnify:CR=1 FL=1
MDWLNKIPISIRLSISYAMWSSSLIIIVSCGCYKTIELLLYRSIDAALISVARSINDASFSGSNVNYTPSKTIIDYNNKKLKAKRSTNYHSIRPFAQVINVSGEVYSKTKNMRVKLPITPNALKRANDSLLTYETFTFKNKSPLRQISFPVIKQGRFDGNLIQVGTSLGSTIYILRSIRLVLWFFAPFMCIMSIALGYFITSRALTPVRKITDSARRISIEDLGVRFKLPEASDEIRDLSLAFNTMFDRLELSVNKLKRFIGDVSHELRTPLSVISIESQLALRRQRTVPEYKATLNTVQNETKHMTQIVDDLLLLTKAENNFMPSPGEVTSLHLPSGMGIRVDTHIYAGYKIPPYYDSMICKLIVHAPNRLEAIEKMKGALSEMVIEGVKTIIPYQLYILNNKDFINGNFSTNFLNTIKL